jgi:hypothetical protein
LHYATINEESKLSPSPYPRFPDKAFSLQLPGRKREATGAVEKIHPTFLFTRAFIGEDVMALLVLKFRLPPADPFMEHIQA